MVGDDENRQEKHHEWIVMEEHEGMGNDEQRSSASEDDAATAIAVRKMRKRANVSDECGVVAANRRGEEATRKNQLRESARESKG